MLIDPENTQHYYAATDVGVFRSTDGGASWLVFGVGLPNVVVNDFAFQPETRELFAGTYGRSIFSTELDDFLIGDVNCDGELNLLDVTPFVEAVSNGVLDPKADMNQDGADNLLDVVPFIDAIAGN